jgi:hypothetical protein
MFRNFLGILFFIIHWYNMSIPSYLYSLSISVIVSLHMPSLLVLNLRTFSNFANCTRMIHAFAWFLDHCHMPLILPVLL